MEGKEQLNEYGETEIKVDTEHLKCEACGGNMVFDPEKQMLFCEHCGSTQIIDQKSRALELNIQSAFSSDSQVETEEKIVFTCDNCGAKVVLDDTETALNCPFCGTGHVQKSEALKGIKPNAILPFKFDIKKAMEIIKAWAKKKTFAPNAFKKNMKTENVRGVYTPCFTFDSQTISTYEGKIGKTHTRTVGSGKNRRVETYVVWRHISGTYYHNFDDVMVAGGQKVDQAKMDKLSPYSTNDSVEYDESYMLGFMAYRYDREVEEMWGTAKGRMDRSLRNMILGQYSYDRVAYLNVSTQHTNVTYKYLMLPVYVGNFNYKKKLYNE